MAELAIDSAWLVHIAALLQVLGLLLRGQLLLRLFILVGTVFYAAYYYVYPDEPLWAAIFWSAVLGAANLVGIARLLWERVHFRQTEDERHFLRLMKTLTPGELRRLMRLAEWRTAKATTTLTQEGQPVAKLYFVLDGRIEAVKDGRSFALTPGIFIGEVAFLMNTPASATVFLQAGAKYIEWPADALHRVIDRTPSLGISMERLFNRELARKVAHSWGG